MMCFGLQFGVRIHRPQLQFYVVANPSECNHLKRQSYDLFNIWHSPLEFLLERANL
jgi:hypothetical protein